VDCEWRGEQVSRWVGWEWCVGAARVELDGLGTESLRMVIAL
jgi:hypothetical protein